MADLNKFEEMLERLVNEDKAGAEELFHEIVVEKSRDIYESLLEDEEVDETTDEEVDEASDEEVDEATDEEVDEADDEDLDENFDLDEFEVEADDEADPMADMGGDMGDDMAADMGDEMGDEEGEGDVEDRVEDLEDALDELKAEFEKMMSGDDGEEGDDMDMDADDAEMDDEADEAYAFEATDEEVDEAADEEVDEATDEEVDEAADEEVDEADKSEAETMREYVEKVSATMGDNGANTKSAVAGKNDMGGTAGNLVQGETADESGTSGGLANPAEKEDNAGNVNVPGGKASKSMKSQPGHGAEKKGKPEAADKGAGSPLNGAPKRAK